MSTQSTSHRLARRAGALLAVGVAIGALVFGLSRLNLPHVARALIDASPGWLVVALALMMLSLIARSISWYEVLRAALPGERIAWPAVLRALTIGVMASALLPGRVGEPARILVLSRHLAGRTAAKLAIVAGTVLSQTAINLIALGILAAVTLSSVQLAGGHASALQTAIAVPLLIALFVLGAPYLLRLLQRSRSARLRAGALALGRLLQLARQGLRVFATPRHGLPAVTSQLLAWALQWASCYMVLLALGLQHHAPPAAAAAAVLLAVNVSAVLPATPSNVGVFQAACLVVLAAYGVGAGPALAYGVILQAIELLTALALGLPALFREGLSWQDVRSARASAQARE